jgi:hypothetical protein
MIVSEDTNERDKGARRESYSSEPCSTANPGAIPYHLSQDSHIGDGVDEQLSCSFVRNNIPFVTQYNHVVIALFFDPEEAAVSEVDRTYIVPLMTAFGTPLNFRGKHF